MSSQRDYSQPAALALTPNQGKEKQRDCLLFLFLVLQFASDFFFPLSAALLFLFLVPQFASDFFFFCTVRIACAGAARRSRAGQDQHCGKTQHITRREPSTILPAKARRKRSSDLPLALHTLRL
jgi:hypothetical protein